MGRRVCTITLIAAFSLVAPGLIRAQEGPPGSGGEHVPRAQEPKRPLPYVEEEVRYRTARALEIEIAGTFTKPRREAAVPAVLLISGAGPQDRDETTAGHKPFLVLADFLTRHNFAVLRVDKRGVGQSTGDYKTATTADFASDAAAGLQYLASRKDVDPKHVGMIGLGEGAIEATMIAASAPQLASFAVLLNGTAYSGEKVLLEQTSRAEMASGFPEDEIDADLRIGAGVYRMVAASRSQSEIEQALDRVPEEYRPFAEPWKRRLPQLQSPWLKFFLNYDPAAALEKIKCPVLALFGEKDMTIDPDLNAAEMKSIFSRAHNREAKVKTLPGLNYLLQKADTGLSREYATISETMSPGAMETISNWIAKQTEH